MEDFAEYETRNDNLFSPAHWRDSDRSHNEKMVVDPDLEPYLYIKYLQMIGKPPLFGKPKLPRKKTDKKTLILDLDETLVHCSTDPMDNPDQTFTVKFNEVFYHVYAKCRPHLQEFIETVSQWYEIIIFTASQEVYANKIIDIIDTKGLITHRLFRKDCIDIDGNFVKDLESLGRNLSETVIVDNSPQTFGYQLTNGVPIVSWFDCEEDNELMKLISLLDRLRKVSDFRELLAKEFQLESIVNKLTDMELKQFIDSCA